MKIAITGAAGRVGSALSLHFQKLNHEVISLSRAELNLSSDAIESDLDARWDVLLNPAAISSPDACELEPEMARVVNTLAPSVLASWCAIHDVKFVHFSTDYVFSGGQQGKRACYEPAHPQSVYGKTKREGEIAVLAANPNALVVRISWIYGSSKPGFVDSVLDRLLLGQRVEAICDKFSLPTHINELACWLNQLLTTSANGIIHACHRGEPVSWHEIACEIAAIIEKSSSLSAATPIVAQQLADNPSFRAIRPIHTAMDCQSLEQWIGPVSYWKPILIAHVKKIAAQHHA